MYKGRGIKGFHTLLYIILMLLLACCSDRPDGVVSQSKMVDILYDYHLAQGLVMDLPYDSTHLVKAYMQAVYENNNITEAEFDSSMVYYHRHNELLTEIYNDLQERFEEEESRLVRQIGSNEMLVFAEGGDTANIWVGKQLYVLHYGDLVNKHTFKVKCDSNFHQHDRFIMEASVAFVRENMEDRNYYVDLCLSLEYMNGRTVSQVIHINNEGRQRLNISAVDSTDLKSLSGFFYYEGKPGGRNIGLVRNITLLRMHEQQEEPDTTSQDSISGNTVVVPAVSIQQDTGTILSPEQKREQSLEDAKPIRQVEILEAPKIRTPNRDVKTRRKK